MGGNDLPAADRLGWLGAGLRRADREPGAGVSELAGATALPLTGRAIERARKLHGVRVQCHHLSDHGGLISWSGPPQVAASRESHFESSTRREL